MATRFLLDISTNADITQPVISGARKQSAINLSKLFNKLAGGNFPATTVSTMNTAVKATGTVTYATTAATGSTAVINGVTFTGGQYAARVRATLVSPVATDAVTLQGVAFTATQLNARGKVAFSTVVATNSVTVGATTFVGTAGAVTPGDATFSVDTDDTAAATSLAAQINAHAVASLLVSATSATTTVMIRALSLGTGGNAIAFAKSGAPITITNAAGSALAGAFLEGGLAQTATGWDAGVGATDTQAAAGLAAVVNASTNAAISGIITATSAAGVVTFKAVTEGTAGNAFTVTKTGAPITLTAQGGGADTGVFQNGAAAGTNTFDSIYNGGTVAQVASSLASSINRSATALVSGYVTATSAAGVTTISAVTPGITGNTITLSVAGTGPTASGARLTGGTESLITASY